MLGTSRATDYAVAMPYRRHGEALEIPTAEGMLRTTFGPDSVELDVGGRGVRIADCAVTAHASGRTETFAIAGRLVVARHILHEDISIWLELGTGPSAVMRRVFGVAPASMLGPDHLSSSKGLAEAARQIRTVLSRLSGDVVRAVELGTGRDPHKLLLVELADRHLVFACRLFRGEARLVMTVFNDGRVAFLHHPREIRVDARIAVGVRGDSLRFTSNDGGELARVSMPWLAPDDRAELARRLGHLIARPPGTRVTAE
jgi:hypothetical protein